MNKKSFNLTTDPWIKVVEMETNKEKVVSLIELFQSASEYRQLAGEMRSQDLSILRFLLAIVTTVYSRVDVDGNPYDWMKSRAKASNELELNRKKIDKKKARKSLLATWNKLYQSNRFSEAAIKYLNEYKNRFDLFGERPFYQVTAEDYDSLVPRNKRISTGSGQVAVRQINRRISQSGNTAVIFSPKSDELKDEVSLDEFVRWLITYQNYTGTTDKTKVVFDKTFTNKGWIYNMNPVFAEGRSLFETLMLNLILVDERQEYSAQRPVWEFESMSDYIDERKKLILPNNLAELYTTWSRILHVEWDALGMPKIFSAMIPMFENKGAFVEPMTTWKFDEKANEYQPEVKNTRSIGTAMWREFGQFVRVRTNDNIHEPGIVGWLRTLKKEKLIWDKQLIVLDSVTLISDGKASQSPLFEIIDNIQMQADVLFDLNETNRWTVRIEDVIKLTQGVGKDFESFLEDIGEIRGLNVNSFVIKMSSKFYDHLNESFRAWLENLTGDDDRDKKINDWKDDLKRIANMEIEDIMRTSSPKDIQGIYTTEKKDKKKKDKNRYLNVFIAENELANCMRSHFNL
ncbi:type I-E CRISPR-associated protein Cse1/CasA [Lactiplantibacillus dongliensis]|uniref:Type I-E CRISPR-associated protein Cse1/CasA n=1 Tax=Lactiplantibacillus dongliensis TaxID=2559919 RepID=A0ABW1R4J9_9LACO|nr:type I-E CRISPR-associated protein Cse1/CasA [Lactiplantibacillus dongliensis]